MDTDFNLIAKTPGGKLDNLMGIIWQLYGPTMTTEWAYYDNGMGLCDNSMGICDNSMGTDFNLMWAYYENGMGLCDN